MNTHRKYQRSSFIFWGVAFALTLLFCLVWGFKPSLAFGLVGSGGLLMLMAVQNVARKKGRLYLYQAGYALFFGAVALWSAWAIYTIQDRLGVALLGAFGLLSLYIALWGAWQAYKDYKAYRLSLEPSDPLVKPYTFSFKALTGVRKGQPVYMKGDLLYGDMDCQTPIGVVITTGSFSVEIPDMRLIKADSQTPLLDQINTINNQTFARDLGQNLYGMGKHESKSTPPDYDPSGLDGKE